MHSRLNDFRMSQPKHVLTEIRAYLLAQKDAGHPGNRVEADLKLKISDGRALITLGPTIDRGPDPTHFYFNSGARLSFGITIKAEGSDTRLLSYRFDYRNDQSIRLPVVRFELRESPHDAPLLEPRAHFHPGIETVRLPMQLLNPLEILDLLFFVLEPGR